MSKRSRQFQGNYGQKSNRRIRKQMKAAEQMPKATSKQMQSVKKVLMFLSAVAIVFFAISCLTKGNVQIFFLCTGAFTIAVLIAVWLIKWRCPHCGKQLGRSVSNTYKCRYCGKII